MSLMTYNNDIQVGGQMIWESSRPNFLLSHAVESVMSSPLFVMFRFGVLPLAWLPVGGVSTDRENAVHCHWRLWINVPVTKRERNHVDF